MNKEEPFLIDDEMWLDLKGICGVDPVVELKELITEAEEVGEEVYVNVKLLRQWFKDDESLANVLDKRI
jgi:hypothetical protein